MQNLITKFLGSGLPPTAAERSAERFKQFERKGRGGFFVYLPPARDDELHAKLIAISDTRALSIDTAAERRTDALRAAKADYDARVKAIDSDFLGTRATADAAFDEAEAKLLAEYAAPLTPEQIALLTTPVGSVVRVNGGSLPADAVTA
jgi:hypothetical protein